MKSPTDKSPVLAKVAEQDISSAVAIAGHPVHAMAVHFPIALAIGTLAADLLFWWSGDAFWMRLGLWAAGGAFLSGVAAGLVGTAELLLVPGIRSRAASWTHAIAAMMFLSICGMNWLLRLMEPESILPLGLALSLLGAVFTGLAGWHGGKLIMHHGVGIMVSDQD
jgi:uncharacterized membrane protein